MKRPSRAVKITSLVSAGLIAGSILLTPAGAHVNKNFGHLWKKHIKPAATKIFYTKKQSDNRFAPPKFLYSNGGGGATSSTQYFCATQGYTPKRAEVAHGVSVMDVIGGTGGTTFRSQVVYSADGGTTYQTGKPSWYTAATAPAGAHASVTNQGVFNLTPGTSYRFAIDTSRFAGGDSAGGGECKLTVQITPDTGDSVIAPATRMAPRTTQANRG